MSGVLRIRKELDFEKQQFFNLTLVAEDRGVPSLISQTFVEVEVSNTQADTHTRTHTLIDTGMHNQFHTLKLG